MSVGVLKDYKLKQRNFVEGIYARLPYTGLVKVNFKVMNQKARAKDKKYI